MDDASRIVFFHIILEGGLTIIFRERLSAKSQLKTGNKRRQIVKCKRWTK